MASEKEDRMSHTPGPWTYFGPNTDRPDQFYAWVVNADTVGHVTVAHVGQRDDARLIAAAPDLLVALKEIAKYERGNAYIGEAAFELKQIARQALKEAE
jgi:hypothetical protein